MPNTRMKPHRSRRRSGVVGWLVVFLILAIAAGSAGGAVLYDHLNTTVTYVSAPGGIYTEAIPGSSAVFTLNPILASDDLSLDAASLIFSGLTKVGPHGLISPDLASDWQVSPTATVYTFTLRSDARWSDGAPFTADDVLYTVQAIQALGDASPLAPVWQGISVTAPSIGQVIFTLPMPSAPFLAQTTVGLLPEHLLSSYPITTMPQSGFNDNPIGTGSFRLNTVSATEIDFNRNQYYYGDPPKLDGVRLLIATSAESAVDLFRQGQVQGVGGISAADVRALTGMTTIGLGPGGAAQVAQATNGMPPPWHTALALTSNQVASGETGQRVATGEVATGQVATGEVTTTPGGPAPGSTIQVATGEVAGFTALYFNLDKPVFRDHVVRQAIDLAIDRQALVNGPLGGDGLAIESPFIPGSWVNALPVSGANSGQAATLLDGAGWKLQNGVRLKAGQPLSFTLMTDDDPTRMAVASAIAAQLGQIGITVNVRSMSFAVLIQFHLQPRQFDTVLYGWQTRTADPDPTRYFSGAQTGAEGVNFGDYHSAALDALLTKARATADHAARAALYGQVAQLLATDLPAVFLYSPRYYYLHAKAVQGVPDDLSLLSQPSDRFNSLSAWTVNISPIAHHPWPFSG